MTSGKCDDRARMAAVLSGDPAAAKQFTEEIAPRVWAACSCLTGDDSEAREAFLEVMAKLRANGFALFGEYSGRSTLDSFVALMARELLSHRVLRLLQVEPEKGWRAFERLFGVDLQKLIRRRLPAADSEEMRHDAYQHISLAIVEKDYARLKSYSGAGSFAGFVFRIADHLLIDFIRSAARRRRLPAPVAKLSKLDQDVFKLVNWQGLPERPDLLAVRLRNHFEGPPDLAEIAASLLRVKLYTRDRVAHHTLRLHPEQEDSLEADGLSPEEEVVEAEQQKQLSAALNVLARAMDTLPDAERLYLTIVLGFAQTPPSREIARLMQRPVEDIYKLRQRVLNRLRDLLSHDAAIKSWRASV